MEESLVLASCFFDATVLGGEDEQPRLEEGKKSAFDDNG